MRPGIFITIAALVVVFSPILTLAVSPSAINVGLFPQTPAPYENVTITLSSYAANLDTVNIEWLVGGRTTSSGVGQKTFQVTTGAAGVETRVVAQIYLPDGQIDKNIILRPANMVMLWQANDAYVPPFYQGKAFPTEGSEIKVVALPEIRVGTGYANPKNLAYEWQKDYSNSPNDSGYGRNFLTYISDYLEPESNFSVVARTLDGAYTSGGSITVGAYEPEILFYRQDPEQGVVWERALPNPYRMSATEEVLFAAPYNISPADIRRPELIFRWLINNAALPTRIIDKNILPVRAEAGASGRSSVRVEIENSDQIYSSASGEINVEI